MFTLNIARCYVLVMTTSVQDVLLETLQSRQLLSHPFYKRWEAGELHEGELKLYAEQYLYFERMLPEFLSKLAKILPNGRAKDLVQENLADEVGPPSHIELFQRFAMALGADDAAISPAMSALIGTYDDVLSRGVEWGLAGLLAYESQGAPIAVSKAEGLRRHYGVSEEDVTFWQLHGELEDNHANWTLDALAELDPERETVREGVGLVADAWWSFLDEREALVS
jgi:pyrroloquinoline-quinone synthase